MAQGREKSPIEVPHVPGAQGYKERLQAEKNAHILALQLLSIDQLVEESQTAAQIEENDLARKLRVIEDEQLYARIIGKHLLEILTNSRVSYYFSADRSKLSERNETFFVLYDEKSDKVTVYETSTQSTLFSIDRKTYPEIPTKREVVAIFELAIKAFRERMRNMIDPQIWEKALQTIDFSVLDHNDNS